MVSGASDTPLVQALPPGTTYHLELQSTSSLTGIVTLALTATDVPSETLSLLATRSYAMSLQPGRVFTPAAGTPYLATALAATWRCAPATAPSTRHVGERLFTSLLLLPATADPLGLLLTSGAQTRPWASSSRRHFAIAAGTAADERRHRRGRPVR